MYNGIGLTTPRGSGTNGYVVRNLSVLRSHETAVERAQSWNAPPPKHREPDGEILEHEKKRKVEVQCLELQLELEDNGLDEADIDGQVQTLRTKLLANLSSMQTNAKSLKPSDTHGIAAAKKDELDRMARALGTRKDYTEGDAFDKEKQEEIRRRRMEERGERERQREEERTRMQAQKEKWEAERKERDRLRRREEDRRRKEREEEMKRRERMPPPPVPVYHRGDRGVDRDRGRRSRSPDRRGPPRDRDDYRKRPSSRSPSPPPRDSHRRPSRSPSPLPRVRRRFDSRSPPRYRRSGSVEPPSRGESGISGSPPPHPKSTRDLDKVKPRSRSPRGRDRRGRSPSRSPSRSPVRSPVRIDRRGRGHTRSPSPPPRGERGSRRGRSPSTESDSSMSVSSRSSSGSRSRSRS
ncbi:unnamed protein product [Somion occarium]|uniref:CWF21 domain-containing protein n=1 Tax=Somion occarium TaxID=3059160 RepID=A0ABP1D1B1_9APHY